jgi:N-hydroxyarylamine O-acetyltransferase
VRVTDDRLTESTRARVLARLGLSNVRPDPDTLQQLYRAWCRSVPFDNVRKRIALRAGNSEALPGGTAEDFFGAWLAHGTGGTCWPTSNALYALLRECGFAVRRIAASMHDIDVPNHGSVVVRFAGEDYLVDSSILCETILPLRRGERVQRDDPVHPIIVEPVDDSFRIWFAFTMNTDSMPCRLLRDPVDHAFYLERYEASRGLSPFNDRLYARRNLEDAVVSYVDSTRFVKTPAGVEGAELSVAEIAAGLVRDLGLSEALVADSVAPHVAAGKSLKTE